MLEGFRIGVWMESLAGSRLVGITAKDAAVPSGGRLDFFISHASEDKAEVARPLYQRLVALDFSVWLDEAELVVGDSLRSAIDAGLKRCEFGVVILSEAFFRKPWAQAELNALFTREMGLAGSILPIWHGLSVERVAELSPLIADRLAARTSDGMDAVVAQVVSARMKRLLRTPSP